MSTHDLPMNIDAERNRRWTAVAVVAVVVCLVALFAAATTKDDGPTLEAPF